MKQMLPGPHKSITWLAPAGHRASADQSWFFCSGFGLDVCFPGCNVRVEDLDVMLQSVTSCLLCDKQRVACYRYRSLTGAFLIYR